MRVNTRWPTIGLFWILTNLSALCLIHPLPVPLTSSLPSSTLPPAPSSPRPVPASTFPVPVSNSSREGMEKAKPSQVKLACQPAEPATEVLRCSYSYSWRLVGLSPVQNRQSHPPFRASEPGRPDPESNRMIILQLAIFFPPSSPSTPATLCLLSAANHPLPLFFACLPQSLSISRRPSLTRSDEEPTARKEFCLFPRPLSYRRFSFVVDQPC